MRKDILVQTLAARLAEDGKEQSSHSTISIAVLFLSFHFHYCLRHYSLPLFALSNELAFFVTIPRLQCDP